MNGNAIPVIYCDGNHFISDDHIQIIAKRVADQLVPLNPDATHIVTVDGFSGVGKSTLAGRFATKMGVQLVQLDDFLERDKGEYLDALRLDELRVSISDRPRPGGMVIMEGCMIDAVLERLNMVADYRIYVMRILHPGYSDGTDRIYEFDVLYGEQSADELISKREEERRELAIGVPDLLGNGDSWRLPGLQRELICYHKRCRPHERADIITKINI